MDCQGGRSRKDMGDQPQEPPYGGQPFEFPDAAVSFIGDSVGAVFALVKDAVRLLLFINAGAIALLMGLSGALLDSGFRIWPLAPSMIVFAVAISFCGRFVTGASHDVAEGISDCIILLGRVLRREIGAEEGLKEFFSLLPKPDDVRSYRTTSLKRALVLFIVGVIFGAVGLAAIDVLGPRP